MNNAFSQLDEAYDISLMELNSLEDQDVEKAQELARQREEIFNNVFSSNHNLDKDMFLEKLLKLQKMQARITDSAKKLHTVLRDELQKVRCENKRFSGYKKASTVTPLFNPYLNKRG